MSVTRLAAAGIAASALAAPAAAERVAVVVVPPFSPSAYADRGAVGLFVPGSGERVSRRSALASLVRGKVESSVTGGIPGGRPLIALARRPADVTIYVALPPPGSHSNVRRYPIALVGGGYRGLLTSSSTRVAGLVSIADVAPTARDLARGKRPQIRSKAKADAPAALARLDRRIQRTKDARLGATLILACAVLGASLAAFALRSRLLARVAVLAAPAALASSLVLSAAGLSEPGLVLVLLAVLTVAASLAVAATAGILPFALVALVAAYLVVFAAFPEVNSVAVIGPHLDGGGRFYGATNLVETVIVAISLLAASLLGLRRLLPIALLVLVTLGWSRAGADGGGLVVAAIGFLALGLVTTRARLTPRAVAAAALAVVVVVLALVGVDAATGGSSHVTRAVGSGPGSLAGDLAHRIHISAASFASSWHSALVIAVSLAVLAVLATRRPRSAVCVALLVAIAVSLVVNDSPSDIAAAGVLSYAAVWVYERTGRSSSGDETAGALGSRV